MIMIIHRLSTESPGSEVFSVDIIAARSVAYSSSESNPHSFKVQSSPSCL